MNEHTSAAQQSGMPPRSLALFCTVRILFFSHYFPPDSNAPATRTFEHCAEWVKAGHDVTVITTPPHHPDGKLAPGYANRLWQTEQMEGIRVLRVWTLLSANAGIARRTLSWISFMLSSVTASLFLRRCDVLIATSPQFFCGLGGSAASFLLRVPLVLEIRDLWPASVVSVGVLKRGIPVRLAEILERFMYSRASHIVTVGEGYRRELLARGVGDEKISVVTNGIDFRRFLPTEGEDLPEEIGSIFSSGRFICSYVGTIGVAHGLDILIKAARLLKESCDESIEFLAAGDGAERHNLEQRAAGLDNIHFTGRIERRHVPALLSLSGCALVHLRRLDLFETVLPSKLFEPWAVKIPVILGVRGDAERTGREAGGAIIIEPENEHELVSAVRKLRDDPELRNTLGTNGFNHALRNFDRRKKADDYLRIIQHESEEQRSRWPGLSLLFRTVRHLRLSQILWRLRFTLERRFPGFFTRPPLPPPLPAVRDLGCLTDIYSLLPTSADKGIDASLTCWRLGPVTSDRLGAVTLHYHEWLPSLAGKWLAGNSESGEMLSRMIFDWISSCDLEADGARDLAWNSYAVATRIGNWILAYSLSGGRFNPELKKRFLGSLWKQASFLSSHVEWDIRANHLIRDALGLALAGRFFDGEEPAKWLRISEEICSSQINEQILPDGGHFERSPAYHFRVLEDLIFLYSLFTDPLKDRIGRAVISMAGILPWISHPDGTPVLFNDSDAREALLFPEIISVVESMLGPVPRHTGSGLHLPDWGLFSWRSDLWSVFFDIGAIGPRYQPGHGHADTLTLEVSFEEEKLLVDPGTFCYDEDLRRKYDRQTASHNTIAVDGEDSSEVWGIFRVGRKANVRNVNVVADESGFEACAEHDGYAHLCGAPIHRRAVRLRDGKSLEIIDTISGSGIHEIHGGFLTAPHWRLEQNRDVFRLCSGAKAVRLTIESEAHISLSVRSVPWHPAIGRELQSRRIEFLFRGQLPVTIHTLITPE